MLPMRQRGGLKPLRGTAALQSQFAAQGYTDPELSGDRAWGPKMGTEPGDRIWTPNLATQVRTEPGVLVAWVLLGFFGAQEGSQS